MKTEIHIFKKGQKLQLDDIYNIQGLAGGDWWRRENLNDDCDENIVITRNITIEIKWK